MLVLESCDLTKRSLALHQKMNPEWTSFRLFMSLLIAVYSFGSRTVQASWLGTGRYGLNMSALSQNCQGL